MKTLEEFKKDANNEWLIKCVRSKLRCHDLTIKVEDEDICLMIQLAQADIELYSDVPVTLNHNGLIVLGAVQYLLPGLALIESGRQPKEFSNIVNTILQLYSIESDLYFKRL